MVRQYWWASRVVQRAEGSTCGAAPEGFTCGAAAPEGFTCGVAAPEGFTCGVARGGIHVW